MNITIFGSGYVGLVTGACFSEAGYKVICVDVDENKIKSLNAGVIPIYEPGLESLIKKNSAANRLEFTTDAAKAVELGDLIFIAVGTPPDEDGSADLTYVMNVAKTIAKHMNSQKIIVDKSTVPVGTAEKVRKVISSGLDERSVSVEFHVCSNPEFLKEGSAIEDFTKGARIVIGTESDWVANKMKECYAPFNRNHDKLIVMDTRSAELTKYAANAMLATKISFMNELANISEKLGTDIESVRNGIGSDPRIGYHFIYPGCGYGGSCFPKDVQALIKTANNNGYMPELLMSVESVNDKQKNTLFKKLVNVLGSDLKGKKIALWGLSFKPNTDDMREAPSRNVLESIWSSGGIVKAYDPESRREAERIYGYREDFILTSSCEEALYDADALVICTEWQEFRGIDPKFFKDKLANPLIIDGRNLYSPYEMNRFDIKYIGVGRSN